MAWAMGLSVTPHSHLLQRAHLPALRKVIPSEHRIAALCGDHLRLCHHGGSLAQAFLPALSEGLGVFIPLIVVNCIILGRAEAFASKNGVLASAADGLTQGLGYTVALVVMSSSGASGRGTFGAGAWTGARASASCPIPTLPSR
ncbi:MAG: Rnf-Nqr domain containing protein [Oscillospiraceae bacterium]